jgi:hypothetical protein
MKVECLLPSAEDPALVTILSWKNVLHILQPPSLSY